MRRITEASGVSLASLYAEIKGAAVPTWGEQSKPEQRKARADLKARLAQASAGRVGT